MIRPHIVFIFRRFSFRRTAAAAVVALAAPLGATEPTDVPFLWMIDQSPPSFLYGTIHLPDERVTTLPTVVTEAFGASDVLYTEIPMDPASQQEAALGFMLKDRTLNDVIDADLWTKLDAFLRQRGLSASMLNSLSPAAVAIQLMMVDHLQAMASALPLDALLEAKATEAGKDTRSLETIREQVDIFASLTDAEQAKLLSDTLEQLENFAAEDRNALEETIDAYLSGDVDRLEALVYQFTDPTDPLDRKIMKSLVTDRNARMSERIRERLAGEPDRVHFFAVGALHYPRRDGILQLLRDAGLDVVRLGPRDVWKIEDRLAVAP